MNLESPLIIGSIGLAVCIAVRQLLIIQISLLLSWSFVKYYQDRTDSEKFVSLISIIGLSITLVLITIVPADIFIVSSTLDSYGMKQHWATTETIDLVTFGLSICYYVLYSAVILFLFLIIPFAYFYFEEWDIETTNGQRICTAFKYTIVLIIMLSALAIGGIFISAGEKPKIDFDWFKKILSENIGDRIFVFLIGILGILGMLVYVSYTVLIP